MELICCLCWLVILKYILDPAHLVALSFQTRSRYRCASAGLAMNHQGFILRKLPASGMHSGMGYIMSALHIPCLILRIFPNIQNLIGIIVDIVIDRSEEHTSELQSRVHLVCRLLLEK